eukprot:TRINITY_DN11890_c0_g1_i1.p1 TRINITY_DN11890_c0_g1~~TRINITY_DN11890_c0_g1_i1.p1  ORF type:complete len:669 (-),score=110.68 TRINITY_DN11890_c0_g1_i1:204-2018(-)
MAVASGWFAAAKMASYSGGLLASNIFNLSTVGLGAGCVYASLGLLHFLRSLAKLSGDKPPMHAPAAGSPEAGLFPSPEWLNTRVLNWAVVGCVGVGKSTLINAMRGLNSRSPGAAPVGVGHTTRKPKPYSFTGNLAALTRNMARLWDLPGAGTKDWPLATYVRDAGLRHFDGVVLVTCGAFSESEGMLQKQLMEFKVPCYVVRNKVDQDAINNAQDNDVNVDDTMQEIRQELLDHGCDPKKMFLISAKHPGCPKFDFGALLHCMASDVSAQRAELPEFCGELLPMEILFNRTPQPQLAADIMAPGRQAQEEQDLLLLLLRGQGEGQASASASFSALEGSREFPRRLEGLPPQRGSLEQGSREDRLSLEDHHLRGQREQTSSPVYCDSAQGSRELHKRPEGNPLRWQGEQAASSAYCGSSTGSREIPLRPEGNPLRWQGEQAASSAYRGSSVGTRDLPLRPEGDPLRWQGEQAASSAYRGSSVGSREHPLRPEVRTPDKEVRPRSRQEFPERGGDTLTNKVRQRDKSRQNTVTQGRETGPEEWLRQGSSSHLLLAQLGAQFEAQVLAEAPRTSHSFEHRTPRSHGSLGSTDTPGLAQTLESAAER